MSNQIDPRGPQFAAALTAVVLAIVLLSAPGTFGVALLGVQALLFAVGALFGVQKTPHAVIFKHLIRPRLGAPTEFEDAAPPRFAQTVGLVFAVLGLVGYLAGVTLLGHIAVGFALAAALLNAIFAFCLGCEVYLLGKRLTTRSTVLA
ncbi:MAG TPA: DUF4395 domain-containing protein [Nocardioides sp.]